MPDDHHDVFAFHDNEKREDNLCVYEREVVRGSEGSGEQPDMEMPRTTEDNMKRSSCKQKSRQRKKM